MSEGLKISEHIYNNAPCNDKSSFSDFNEISSFFSVVSDDVQKLWPLDLSDMGYKTRYEQAQISSEQMGFVQNIILEATVFNAQESYLLKLKMTFDDSKIKIAHESLLQQKGKRGNNFANSIIKQCQKFLTSYDKSRKLQKQDEASEIVLQAHSSLKSTPTLLGGYLWANQGFDFASQSELSSMRKIFKRFLEEKNISITDKDLSKFTKPCHFAAFGCGVQAQDNKGNNVHLGKAFMLEQSWMAQWKTSHPQAEEKRYASAYNQKGILPTSRRRKAVLRLSKAYQNMLRKYYNQYASKSSKISTIAAYKRLALKQIKQLIEKIR